MVRVLGRGASPFRLRLREGDISLSVGEHVVGRGVSCDIVLDDSQVSRQHAQLEVTGDRVAVADLGSINGSFVNGKRIRERRILRPGDKLRFGNSVLELLRREESPTVGGQAPSQPDLGGFWPVGSGPYAQTNPPRSRLEVVVATPELAPHSQGPGPGGEVARSGDSTRVLGESDIPTRRVDGLEVGAAGAQLAFASGQPDQAERFLGGYLSSVLSELEAGRPLPDPTVLEALKLSLHLASKTEKGAWLDYGIKLLLAHGALPPAAQLSQMSDLATRLEVDIDLVRTYESAMSRSEEKPSASEQEALNQLHLLCARAAARSQGSG